MMRPRYVHLVALIPCLVVACTALKATDDAAAPPGSDASESSLDAADARSAADSDPKDPPDAVSPDVAVDARPFTPGPPETVAENLLGGLGVAVTTSHVYWYEQGERAGGSNWDAVFRRLPLTQTCNAGENCGAMLPRPGGLPTFFGDSHKGPVASDAVACVDVISNATRDTELYCLRQSDGTMVRVPGTQFAATVRLAVSGDLYFSVPAKAPQTTSYIRRWSALTPSVVPVDVLTRTASRIESLAIDGATLFWSESNGAMSTVWTQGTGAPEQLAAARPGSGMLTVDASFVYVSRAQEGKVLRYPRAGLTAGVELATGKKTPGPLLRRGGYLLRLDYGDSPDYANSELSRCNADGTDCIVLDSDPAQSGFAATANTAYVVAFGTSPTFKGTIKRVRFSP